MKKIILIFALVASLVVFAACSEPEDSEPVKYSITFIDENGETVATEEVAEGTVPSRAHSVTDTAEWDYTFEGWSAESGGEALKELPGAAADATYYAVVSKVKQRYDVIFEMGGAEEIAAKTVEYGSTVEKPEDPEYEGHRFMGWYSDADGSVEFDWSAPIKSETKIFALWNEDVDIKGLLTALLNGYKTSPYSFIPEAMQPSFDANLVDEADVITDYSSFVNVSDIKSHGFGEQWNMVVDNVNQSTVFHNVLSVIDSIASASVAAFNNYIDKNPQSTAIYDYKSGIYNVTISFDGEVIYYVVDYTDTLPALGEQTVQIALSMDVESSEKTVRMQLGDANALAYTVSENTYAFAIKYLGVRRAYFSLERETDGSVSGKIYEYLTVGGNDFESAAEFFANDSYVTVVGNKADGIIGFTGYIAETYDVESGKLIGYEVEETLSAIKHDTLWFELDSIPGIQSIRFEAGEDGDADAFYINGSSDAWVAKKVGGIGGTMFSRRFDIEFRTQYFYTYDEANGEYKQIKASVPMLFVQESFYDSLAADTNEANGIALSVTVGAADLNAIKSSYDEKLPIFKANKNAVSSDDIVEIIGEKIATNK